MLHMVAILTDTFSHMCHGVIYRVFAIFAVNRKNVKTTKAKKPFHFEYTLGQKKLCLFPVTRPTLFETPRPKPFY